MNKNYAYIITCALINLAIFIYATDNPVDRKSSLAVKLYMVAILVVIPAAITALSATRKKSSSGLILSCSLLTILSGAFFINLYSSTIDPSKGLVLAPHYLLTYVFAIITLVAYRNPAPQRVPHKNYVYDTDANRQISTIIKMHNHGSSSTGIASTLNSNQEPYLIDNSEWTAERLRL